MTFTDEQLSAYLDGALPEEDMNAITDALAGSDELAERLAGLRGADDWLREEFAALEKTPIRQSTLDLINNSGTAAAEADDNVVTFNRPATAPSPRQWPAWGQAIAASITLAVGVFTGMQLDGSSGGGDQGPQIAGLIDASNPLHEVLQTANSMQTVELAEGNWSATPTMTFATEDGYCRELSIVSSATENRSVACQTTGGWLVRASITLPTEAANEGFTTASADTRLIDNTIRTMMRGDSLSAEQEQALINRGWH